LANQNVNLKILILDGSPTGTVQYSETHNVITNDFGLINLQIGNGTLLSGNFTTINWALNSKYVRIELDPTGGSSFQFMGTSQLLSVPYALYSQSSGGGGATYTAGSGISIVGNVISNSSPNQAVNISGSGSTTVSGTYPNFTISSTDNVNDADSNPTNEIQTLSQTGTNVTLSNGGGTISVNDGDTTLWKLNGAGNIYRNIGLIGIGTQLPQYKLHMIDALNDSKRYGVRGIFTGGNNLDSIYGAIWMENSGTNGTNRGGLFRSSGISQGYNIGLAGAALNSQIGNYGVIGGATNPTGSTSIGVGVLGYAENGAYSNVGIGGQAFGNAQTPYITGGDFLATGPGNTSQLSSNNIGVITLAEGNYSENVGVRSTASSSTGTGYAMGSYNIGLHARAIDPSLVNVGVLGEAINGTTSYAGYFDGNVTVTGTFVNPSDIKLKTNVIESGQVLSDLLKLKVKNYFYKDNVRMNLPSGKQYGFIAQDIQLVFPHLVHKQLDPHFSEVKTGKYKKNPHNGVELEETILISEYEEYLGVDYVGLIPLLIKGIQEQQEIIDNQSELINQLNERLLKLEQNQKR
jgi:hypothetical protein